MSPGPPRSGFLVPVLGASYGQIVNLIAKTKHYESLKIQFYIKNTSNAFYIKNQQQYIFVVKLKTIEF